MIETTSIYLIIVFFLIIISAIFSCSETAITAISRAKINRMVNDGNKKAEIIEGLLKKRERTIGSMLIGNNIVNILASVLATSVFLKFFGEAGLIYATIVMTSLVIVFAEILPKTIALKFTDQMALLFAPLISILVKFFSPLERLVARMSEILINIFGKKSKKTNIAKELEEIRDTVELKHKEGSIFKYDKDLIDGVLDLSDVEIGEIMVHRKEIISINIDLSLNEIIDKALSVKHTRIPLWQGNKENIIAILNVRKLLKFLHNKGDVKNFDLKTATSKPWFVPVSNSLREQLVAFRKKRKRLAIVIDEYGSILGMITLEDILEEIVGEINDHEDNEAMNIIKTKSGSYKITGKTLIRDLNKILNWDLFEDNHAYNLNAFIIHHLGRVPEEKESFEILDFKFTILHKRGNNLLLIKIKPKS